MLMTKDIGPKKASDEMSVPQLNDLLQESEEKTAPFETENVQLKRLTDLGGFVQLDGVPVFVNPESTLYANTQAATNFGFTDIPVGLDEVSFM